MSRELCDWLNRAGLIIGFFSFWFAAPEFIGEERLRAWQQDLAAGLLQMPRSLKHIMWMLIVFVIVLYILTWLTTSGPAARFAYVIPPSFLLFVGIVATAFLLSRKFVEPAVTKLANDSNVRHKALIVGAVLFTISFLLELLATFPKAG